MTAYRIEPATIEGLTFLPSQRVILTEWLDGPNSESRVMRGTFAGVLEAPEGFMVVVNDETTGEEVVLAQTDLIAIDHLSSEVPQPRYTRGEEAFWDAQVAAIFKASPR